MAGHDARGRTPLSLVGHEPDLLFYTRQVTERGGPALVLGSANGRVAWALANAGVSVLPERFPVVLAPQHALGLMGSHEDLEAFLSTVRHHLQPEGVFLYDVLNPPVQEPSRNEDEAPGAALEPRRPVFSFHLRERRQSGAPLGIHRLRFKPFAPAELDEAMKACGLTPRERYGRFDGKPFEEGDSRHIGVVEG
jgi:hypothetical protein